MRRGLAIVAFLVPLVVYLWTLARSVTFVDSGELAAVAATLGIGPEEFDQISTGAA